MPTTRTKAKANLLGTTWLSDNDIRVTLTKIQQNRSHHDRITERGRIDLERRRDQLNSSLQGIGERDRSSMVSKAVAGHRAELVRESKDARLALTRELSGLADRIRSAETHYRNPMQMLMRDTLGSERRSRIQQQIANSGPAELASLAELAAATKDRELAAALCGRVYGVKRDERPFDAAELASVLFGEQHRELSQALVEAERRVLEALNADEVFETGKANPQRALQIAMLKKRETQIGAYVKDEPEDEADEDEGDDAPAVEPTASERIEAGLAARRA